jgi:hypothetical protein
MKTSLAEGMPLWALFSRKPFQRKDSEVQHDHMV